MVMERLGPVLVDALLSIPPADDNERLGPVLADALLSIPPARFVIDDEAGAGVGRCFALDTASKYWIKRTERLLEFVD